MKLNYNKDWVETSPIFILFQKALQAEGQKKHK